MPAISLNVAILDWGKPGKPMAITCDDTPLILDIPDHPHGPDKRCIEHATYRLDAVAARKSGPTAVHLGFYGYLRVCNAMCLQKAGHVDLRSRRRAVARCV